MHGGSPWLLGRTQLYASSDLSRHCGTSQVMSGLDGQQVLHGITVFSCNEKCPFGQVKTSTVSISISTPRSIDLIPGTRLGPLSQGYGIDAFREDEKKFLISAGAGAAKAHLKCVTRTSSMGSYGALKSKKAQAREIYRRGEGTFG